MGLTPEQEARLRTFVVSGFLPVLETAMRRMSAPFWWHTPALEGGGMTRGGTICFVHTGQRLIGVTAAHVHREISRLRGDSAGVWCQIGGHTFSPEACLIDIDDDLDLATYSLSEIQVAASLADVHHAVRWPPVVDPKAACIVGGWPWQLSSSREKATDFQFLHFIGRLDSHSEQQLGAVTATSTSIPWGPRALPQGTNLGGMSGGPIFSLAESGVTHLALIGIVYEYQPGFEIVLGRPLSLVAESGEILRSTEP
jgi:hypothetical protein